MADHSKRQQLRQHILDEMESRREGCVAPDLLCYCGTPAKYEVNRGRKSVTFVCEGHLPRGRSMKAIRVLP